MPSDAASQLAGLIEAATPGPWCVGTNDEYLGEIAEVYGEDGSTAVASLTDVGGAAIADAALIVHLVNAAPKYVALMEAADEVVGWSTPAPGGDGEQK